MVRGVAARDVDGDGWIDLYFAQLNGPNRLYKNIGGFEFRAVTDSANVAHENHYSTGTTFADIDGDGDLDLLVGSMRKRVVVYLNDGDGDLDLYVTNYKQRSAEDIYSRDEIATEKIVQTVRTEGGIRASIVPRFEEHFTIVGDGNTRGPAETGETTERRTYFSVKISSLYGPPFPGSMPLVEGGRDGRV